MEFDLSNGWLLNWVLLIGVFGIGLVSPGPDFVVSIRNTLSFGRMSGIFTALGFACGVCIHVTYVLIGFAAIISQSILLFNVIKYAGAAYLLYIGFQALRSKGFEDEKLYQKRRTFLSPSQSFISGFLTNLLNPKATMFFLAVFSQFIGPETLIGVKILYGGTCVVMTFIWFSIVALFLTHPSLKAAFLKASHWIDRICGAALIGLGLKLAFTSK